MEKLAFPKMTIWKFWKFSAWPDAEQPEQRLQDSAPDTRQTPPVTAPQHRSSGLFLGAARGVTIALISLHARKRRQPGLAADTPELIGWLQLVGFVQRPQVHFDFVTAASENRRAAVGTEKSPLIFAHLAFDRHSILREYRGRMEKGAMMLATIQTVTNANPIRKPRRHNPDIAAQAAAGKTVHVVPPLKSNGRNDYNGQYCNDIRPQQAAKKFRAATSVERRAEPECLFHLGSNGGRDWD
ncbi:hypothetical protein [Nisaea nitritireducens]